MPESTYKHKLLVGQYVFEGMPLQKPISQVADPTPKQMTKLWKTAVALGELGWATHLLYIHEWLQGKKLTKEEAKSCMKDLNKYFRRYCPHIKKDITNMELHAAMREIMEEYKPRFTKCDVQAVYLAYQKWQKLPENSLADKRAKAWIDRGLTMIMASRYYQAALPKKEPRSMMRGVMYR